MNDTPPNDDSVAQRHTPGPWRLLHDGEVNDVDFATHEYRWPWRVVGPDDELVVDFVGGEDVSDEDAALIAAAPDLMGALERVGATTNGVFCCCLPPLAYPEHEDQCRQARAAIAKAKGEVAS